MVYYRIKKLIQLFVLTLKGGSYSNIKALMNSKHHCNKDLINICCNLPFDSYSSRLFSTYEGIKYALGKEFSQYYLENSVADGELIHGFIAVCCNKKKYLIYKPDNIILDNVREKEIHILLHKIRKRFNSTPFIDVNLSYSDNALKIIKIDCGKDIVKNNDIYNFLKKNNVDLLFSEKHLKTIREKIKWLLINLTNYIGRKKGMLGFMYRSWLNGCINDYKSNSIKEFYKIHNAHKKGFFFYHVNQYHLTEDNYTEFLSDYEYKKLRPIDGEVWRILWDKLSLNYVLENYKEYIPKHYAVIRNRYNNNVKKNEFYIFEKNNLKAVSPELLIESIKENRIIAAKPFVGSHGNGFYIIKYQSDTFHINNQKHTYSEFKRFLLSFNESYVFTEYVEMSNQFKNVYSDAVSTARIMVIKKDNVAQVVNAYIRFAHKEGGVTDNVANGGIVASIDVRTGKIVKAEKIENHVFSLIKNHPDTGASLFLKIENWVQIKEKICDISKYLEPFTYLGFDIAFTEMGFKIIEINTHQDLHKYAEYNDDIKEFFNLLKKHNLK